MINSKIALSLASIAAAGALVAGATFAYFSSTAESTDNVFSTGELTLLLDDGSEDDLTPAATITASFGGTLVPGGTTSGFVSLHNGGTIDIAEVNLSADETLASVPDLDAQLNITSAKIGSENTCTTSPADITGSMPATLAALNALGVTGLDLPSSALTVGATKFLCMTFELDPLTDDTFQGTSITEDFTFVGHQVLSQ